MFFCDFWGIPMGTNGQCCNCAAIPRGWSGAGVGVGVLRGRGIPLIEKIEFEVYWCLGFLVSLVLGFLGSWFLSFLVS